MGDLACQFMDVMEIPDDLYKILRRKSHGVASWCEQLIKDMLVGNVIMVIPEEDAFGKEQEEVVAPASDVVAPLLEAVVPSKNPTGTIERCKTPFYRSESPLLELDGENPERRRSSLPAATSKNRSGSMFGKLRVADAGLSEQVRRKSTGMTFSRRASLKEGFEKVIVVIAMSSFTQASTQAWLINL